MFVIHSIACLICITARFAASSDVRSDEPEAEIDLRCAKISGEIGLSETFPKLQPLLGKGAGVMDKKTCAAAAMLDERLVVSEERNCIVNVFVRFERMTASKIHPDSKDMPSIPVKWSSKGCRLETHVLCV